MILEIEKKFDDLSEDVKNEAESFLDYLLIKSGINSKIQNRKPGFMKDKIFISEDFDEPLEEFREY